MNLIKLISIIYYLLLNFNCFKSFDFNSQIYRNKNLPNLKIWLTIHPETKIFDNPFKAIVISQRLFVLNWSFKDSNLNKSDWIGLFDRQLNSNDDITPDQSLFSSDAPSKDKNAFVISNKKYPILDFQRQSDLPRGCLAYYIGYFRDKKLLASNCLAAYSTWMKDIYEQIKNVPIHDLQIPGTHNSGAFSIGYPQTNIAKRKINDYTLCQDESIFNQLIYGIRHLDLRIAYKGGNHFTITHDRFTINNDLNHILDDIARFIELSSGEIVIVDFHRFPVGFPKDNLKFKETHKKLFEIIKNKLGKYIMPAVNQRYLVKFGELINKNKRIIIGYASWFALDDFDRQFVWPASIHIWKDESDSLEKLLPFLKQKVCTTHRNELEAAAAFLTPIAKNVILNKYKSLRALSAKVNRPLTDEFRESIWSNCSNVILTDFFLGNNLIELSIESNLKRFI